MVFGGYDTFPELSRPLLFFQRSADQYIVSVGLGLINPASASWGPCCVALVWVVVSASVPFFVVASCSQGTLVLVLSMELVLYCSLMKTESLVFGWSSV